MRLSDRKGIAQAFHKAIARVDAYDLAAVSVITHGCSPSTERADVPAHQ